MTQANRPLFVSTFAVLGVLLSLVAADAAEFKLATVAPENSQWMQDMRTAAAAIKARTDGRVTLKLYGGGVMGNERQVLRKIRIGQLQGGAFTANGIAEIYPDIVVYGLPMLFESQDEVSYVRQRMDQTLAKGLEDAGFVSFGFAGGGFARILAHRPVTRLADLKGQKIWIPEGDRISYEAMRALQLSPVSLPVTDVLTGLQTGLIDIIAAPPVGVVALQWQTRVKFMTSVPLMYTMGLVALDSKAFVALSKSDQAIVREVMATTYGRLEQQSTQDELQAIHALEFSGIRVVAADAADLTGWRQTVTSTNRRLGADGVFNLALLDRMSGYLQEFRSRKAASAPTQQARP